MPFHALQHLDKLFTAAHGSADQADLREKDRADGTVRSSPELAPYITIRPPGLIISKYFGNMTCPDAIQDDVHRLQIVLRTPMGMAIQCTGSAQAQGLFSFGFTSGCDGHLHARNRHEQSIGCNTTANTRNEHMFTFLQYTASK